MSDPANPALVKLSAENLLLRQRLAQIEKENKRLRQTIGNRNQIIDAVTIRTLQAPEINKGQTR